MGRSAATLDVLVSTLADDPDLGEIITMFANELPDRAEAMEHAAAEKDYRTLETLAHQLKGAAGGYGYPTITEAARVVELAAKSQAEPRTISSVLSVLTGLCRRARGASSEGRAE